MLNLTFVLLKFGIWIAGFRLACIFLTERVQNFCILGVYNFNVNRLCDFYISILVSNKGKIKSSF